MPFFVNTKEKRLFDDLFNKSFVGRATTHHEDIIDIDDMKKKRKILNI